MIKQYNVTVNGTTYEVTVESAAGGRMASAPVSRAAAAPVARAAAPAPAAAPAEVAAGDTPVNAPMPGKVSKIVAKPGQTVKKGDVLLLLEAMKMQNEIGSPVAGTVKSVNVAAGENVKPGQIMAVIG